MVLIGLCLYGLMSSVVTLLTVTLPLPSHWGHGAGCRWGASVL